MNGDLRFLASLVESEVLSNPEYASLGQSALLEACMEVAVYAIPLPDGSAPGVPSEFLRLAVQVGREAFAKLKSQLPSAPAVSSIDEAVLSMIQVLDYGLTEATVPERMPRSAYVMGEAEWSWSPHHERWSRWYISMDSLRTSWVLWEFTPNWSEWGFEQGDTPVALMSRNRIGREAAARHLLVAFLRREAKESDLEEFHSVTPRGILSYDDFDAVSAAVWGSDDDGDAEPLIDKNRINDVVIRAWRERVQSLSTS